MLLEERYVMLERPDEEPEGLPWTVVARCLDEPEPVWLHFRETWRQVASWGRWCDEHLGPWPSDELLLDSLPPALADYFRNQGVNDVQNWLDDLRERQWIVWSAAIQGKWVKVDLSANALPLSSWPLAVVFESVGAKVIDSGPWTSTFDEERRLKTRGER